jgi:hypothetical protein
MTKTKNTRRAEAIKKAKRNKTIAVSAGAVVTVVAVILLIIYAVNFEGGTNKPGIIDLTVMTGLMSYSTVSDINRNPGEHIGSTIIARGRYHPVSQNEMVRHYIIIESGAGCCPQRLEFIWDGGQNRFPHDYPAEGSMIEVSGIFSSYDESRQTFYYLAVEEIVIR